MKKLIALAAAGTALALGATAAQAETRQERNEARLAEMIEGRTAGEPQACVTSFRSNDIEVIPYVGIVYDAGDTIYVARATRPNQLRSSDVPIIERHGSQLCRHDVMRTIDRHSGFTTGGLFLEDFVPYTKPKAEG